MSDIIKKEISTIDNKPTVLFQKKLDIDQIQAEETCTLPPVRLKL